MLQQKLKDIETLPIQDIYKMPEFKKDSNRIYNEALGFLTQDDKTREYKMQAERESRPHPSDSLLRDIL